jgi:sigma-B regulation protein RsbU (phosphoserine phosphatase)
MKQVIQYIRQHLSLRLGIIIVLVTTITFSMLFGFMFSRSKSYIQQTAIDRAMQILDNTAERINGILDETETVTNFLA